MVLIMEFALYNDISCFIKNMAIIIGIIIVANFITIVMHPGGLYTDSRGWKANWVMGYYNSHIFTYLPWLAFSYMYIYKLRGKLSACIYNMWNLYGWFENIFSGIRYCFYYNGFFIKGF